LQSFYFEDKNSPIGHFEKYTAELDALFKSQDSKAGPDGYFVMVYLGFDHI
jgi:hypothetical protein